ncbi:hypothetical protein Gotur_019472 [Gossypium turneri]
MDKATPTPESPPVSPPQQAALHQDDAADDDENVKQLKECSALYLSLQVNKISLIFPSIVLLRATGIGNLVKWVCFKFFDFLVSIKTQLIYLLFDHFLFLKIEVQALKACNERRKK